MKRKEFRGVMGIAALLYLLFTQMAYGQETKGEFTVSGGTSSFAGNVLTVSDGEVTVSTNGVTSQTIKLTGGKLILAGVEITVESGNVSPIEVAEMAEVEIELAQGSTSVLKSNSNEAAGIHVPAGSQVTFIGSGKLTAENMKDGDRYSYSSCGIGGKYESYSCGKIIFNLDGSVYAKGGNRAAGIGTCIKMSENVPVNGDILIKKGTIEAIGGEFAAGIGTGPDGSAGGEMTVTMEGGTVKARGGSRGGGLGTGLFAATSFDIFLLGGTITADVAPGLYATLNTLVVGPDVIIVDNTISDKYTNGFVFSGSPKTATVKGNPVFPEGQTITIDQGEKLTVPNGTDLTNNGTIINNGTITNDGKIFNNGTITNNGTINGDGAIMGNIPAGWNGNTAYITYDANGGSGTVADTYHKAVTITDFPSTDGLSKDGYTCLGWNTTNDATEALTEYAVLPGANTLYALWKIAELELTNTAKEITGTVGTAFAEVDLSANVSNKEAVLGITFALKQDNSLPTGFSLSADGKLTGPNPLTTAISGATAIVTVTPKNGASAKELTLTFNIAKGALVVTPVPDQTIYAGEYPAYSLPEYVAGEPHITGNLAVANGVIKKGNLALTEKGRENHVAIELSAENISITQKAEKPADAVAEIVPSGSGINPAGWYRNPVTLNAPAGFKIWVEAISKTKAAPTLRDTYRLTEDGLYTGYRLVRTATNADYSHDIDIKLDQTAPELKADFAISSHKATFTLADALSGIASYSYVLDGAEPSEMKTVEDAPKEYEVDVMAAVGPHTITFTIWDVAGNKTTSALVDFTLPLPTVTLPDVEGVTFNPLAGSHEVKPLGSFRFYLTLEEGYKEKSQPVVTTDRGYTINPRPSDGAYVIFDISQDIVISISGIVPDISTGIAGIDNATHIRTVDGTLQITVPQPTDAIITDTSGRLLRTLQLTPGTTRVEGLHPGIYIVKISGQEGRKVIVK